MAYMHIYNLYKNTDILLFKECYALEKIHGTSAHLSWKDAALGFFAGGASHENFVKLFDAPALSAKLLELFGNTHVMIFGEAYGGKLQGMSATYGKDLCFVAFDVKVDETWWSVPEAAVIAQELGLPFVSWQKIPTDLNAIDFERDQASIQAERNGVLTAPMREGVVLRPLIEVRDTRGNRIMAKHKRPEFSERASAPEVDPAKRKVLEDAQAVAAEWVTEMRLSHVLDHLGNPREMERVVDVIKAMVEDVTREAQGEIIESKDVRKAIGARAAQMFKRRVMKVGGA